MLVLSRKKGESIMIGDQIELVVIGVDGDNIRIGIQAPKHIEVYRKEVYISILDTNKEASIHSISPQALSEIFKKSKET